MIQKKELQIKTEDDNFKAKKYQIEIEVNILNTTYSRFWAWGVKHVAWVG